MPGIARKLVIIAAIDGLLLQPLHQHRAQKPSPTLQLRYASHDISVLKQPLKPGHEFQSFEAHGVVGLFTVASSSYLISISSRRQVAQIRGKPVYVITGVSIIPLSSQQEASKAIEQAKESAGKKANKTLSATSSDESDASDSEDEHNHLTRHSTATDVEDDGVSTVPGSPGPTHGKKLEQPPETRGEVRPVSIIQDVIVGKGGQYGKFAERWFSKKGWSSSEKKVKQGITENDNVQEASEARSKTDDDPKSVAKSTIEAESHKQTKDQATATKEQPANVTLTLLPKLLRTTKLLLSSSSFFFSYDYDITRRLDNQPARGSDLPLHKIVDPLFFWNRHLTSRFSDNGHDAFILPLMQGFVGQRSFTINKETGNGSEKVANAKDDLGEIIELQKNASNDEKFKASAKTESFLLTLISRRATTRPGLRYLRRGVNDEGHVANGVETEQLLSDPEWNRTYSYMQVRGSIPLYFSQSPYSFKPVPTLQHSYNTNHAAFKRHFTVLKNRYGSIQIALLVDKSGGEKVIGEEYEKHTQQLNSENGIGGSLLDFEWFDFHNICRGMKFENVSILMDTLRPTFASQGMTIERDGSIQQKQTGIIRTNCMDCLDRTNVVQSACGQQALESQLQQEGITIDLQSDATSTGWFNTLWADNGDAISKQYSSTAALKGDYTRTRKRDYRGAINDFGLTISRYYNNIVNDYFSQAAIDFLLGNVGDEIFEEFEAEMMSKDPALEMGKVREKAVETSVRIVVEDVQEDFKGGWTLLSPVQADTLRSQTLPSGLMEVVLLLTDRAVYVVRYDWNNEKVEGFERVDLDDVRGLTWGAYVTGTVAQAQMDEKRNVGFLLKYVPGIEHVMRRNTRSLSTAAGALEGDPDDNGDKEESRSTGTASDGAVDQEHGSSANTTAHDSGSLEERFLAFKALPAKSNRVHGSSSAKEQRSEEETIVWICDEIARVKGVESNAAGDRQEDDEKKATKEKKKKKKETDFIKMEDIISAKDARKKAGLWEMWGHELKKLVWA